MEKKVANYYSILGHIEVRTYTYTYEEREEASIQAPTLPKTHMEPPKESAP